MEEAQQHSTPSLLILPDFPPAVPTHQCLPNQEEILPLDIDWVTLLSGSSESPSALSSSSFVGGNGGAACVGMNLRSDDGHTGGVRGGGRSKKSTVTPRIAFHTRSEEDVLDDGYKWRKYGQKSVKNSTYPRSYYRCTYNTCNVKKQVQRLSKDTSIVVTTYEGIHNHPSEKLMETLTPLLNQLQFLAKF